jgi:dihydrofolate reductase
MGRIVVSEFVSLDGVAEDPGGAEGSKFGAWTFKFDRGDAGNAFKTQELEDAEALLLGRITYQGFAKAWPAMRDQAGPFGELMHSVGKYVVSNTLPEAEATWNNSTVVRGSIKEVAALKDRVSGNLLVAGSCQLASALISAGLVDELRLMVFPILLGSGKRIFPADVTEPPAFKLSSAPSQEDGVLMLTYVPR